MIPASLLCCNEVTVVEADEAAGIESQRAKVFRPGRLVGCMLLAALGVAAGFGPNAKPGASDQLNGVAQ